VKPVWHLGAREFLSYGVHRFHYLRFHKQVEPVAQPTKRRFETAYTVMFSIVDLCKTSLVRKVVRMKQGLSLCVTCLFILFLASCQTLTPTSPTPDESLDLEPTLTTVRWSDPATWGGNVPRAGQNVEVPKGKAILLDVSTPSLGNLTINGTLVFADKDLTLTAKWIMVHGRLEVGVPSKLYTHKAVITLTGPDEDVMGMGGKVLGVMGGLLALHGERKTPYVKLAANVKKGDTVLTLSEAPGWRVGDKIVLASSDFAYEQAEEFSVKAINANKVTLNRAVKYLHWGQTHTYGGKVIDERAEVVLLSRNIVVQGNAVSEDAKFGGHVMVMGSGSRAYVEGVEFYRMGQSGKMGRYPMHWHLLGDTSTNQYLRYSSVHHSFNRCVTIHGSNGIKIQSNAMYDAPGHCFFLEDGAEKNNLFEKNIGLSIIAPATGKRLLPTDTDFPGPAVYWISNPANTFRNNVAAGSAGSGFWIALPKHPTGLSANNRIWPRYTAFTEFSGNKTHSSSADGLHVDSGPQSNPQNGTETTVYEAHKNPAAVDANEYNTSAEVTVTFDSLTSYKNRRNGAWLRGKNHILLNAILADNAVGVTFASDKSILKTSTVIGETPNVGTAFPWEKTGLGGRSLPKPWDGCNPGECFDYAIRGFEFYDGKVGAEDSYFAEFKPNSIRQAAALSYLDFTGFSVSPLNYAKGLRFASGTKRVYLATRGNPADPRINSEDGYRSAVFQDQDGSVTGTAGRYVVVNNPFLLTNNCTKNNDWNAWVCNEKYTSLTLYTDSPQLASVSFSQAGKTQTMFGSGAAPGTYFRSQSYNLSMKNTLPSKFGLVLQDGSKKWLRLSIALNRRPTVSRYGNNLSAETSLAKLDNANKTSYFYDSAFKVLHIKIVGVNWYKPSEGTSYEALEVQP
jgi:cell surface hyaluronidase